jgi:ankyrin repeat protein
MSQQFIGEPEGYSDTHLHCAVSAGRFDICQNLLRLGANPLEPAGTHEMLGFLNIADHVPICKPVTVEELAATSPLFDALRYAQIEIVDLFIRHILASDSPSLPKLSMMGLMKTPTLIHM